MYLVETDQHRGLRTDEDEAISFFKEFFFK